MLFNVKINETGSALLEVEGLEEMLGHLMTEVLKAIAEGSELASSPDVVNAISGLISRGFVDVVEESECSVNIQLNEVGKSLIGCDLEGMLDHDLTELLNALNEGDELTKSAGVLESAAALLEKGFVSVTC